jgi:hypothetical protein
MASLKNRSVSKGVWVFMNLWIYVEIWLLNSVKKVVAVLNTKIHLIIRTKKVCRKFVKVRIVQAQE